MSELQPCEAIEILEDIYPSKRQIVTGEYPQVAEALDMAIDALRRAQQEQEKNDPLTNHIGDANKMVPMTLGELRKIDGEPVWIVSDRANGHREEWKIVVHCGPNCTEWIGTESAWSNADCGVTWFAYRHKPKEDSYGRI